MGVIYMYIDWVYGLGAMYMHVNCVYGCYGHVCRLCIWVLCTCILIVYMGAIYMFIDCVYECYMRVF